MTKLAAEKGIKAIIEKAPTKKWIRTPFSEWSQEKAQVYLAQFQFIPEDEELSADELIDLNAQVPQQISLEEAKADIEYLFQILSHGYSGYGYFRTKGDFDQAKFAILKDLESRSMWSPSDFSKLIYEHLNFVHDGHLRIEGRTFFQHEDFWYNTGLTIWRTEKEYFFISDNKRWKIETINERPPEEFLFPSLKEGEPNYVVGVLSQSAPEPLTLEAKDESGIEKSFEIRVYNTKFEPQGPEKIFEEKNFSGIPVVYVGSFSDSHGEELEAFLETAQKYRGEPYLILDIRGNGGGNSEWARKWVEAFTGYNPEWYFTDTVMTSRTTLVGQINLCRQFLEGNPGNKVYTEYLESVEEELDTFEAVDGSLYWSELFFPDMQLIPNPTRLIVLVDSRVCSSGEGFIGYLRQLENVTFVGENSAGIAIFGDLTLHQLPHSNLLVYLALQAFLPCRSGIYRGERVFP